MRRQRSNGVARLGRSMKCFERGRDGGDDRHPIGRYLVSLQDCAPLQVMVANC